MTDTSTPAVLGHGPLTADMVPLLKAGSSVLRQEMGTSGVFAEASGERIRIDGFGGGFCGGPIRTFTYIGERDADGWITAPEGGWESNPVPGMRVDTQPPDEWPGIPWASVTAFRLSAPLSLGGQNGPSIEDPGQYDECMADQGSSAAPLPSARLDDPWAELERLAKAALLVSTGPDARVKSRRYRAVAHPATILKLIEAARQGPAGYEGPQGRSAPDHIGDANEMVAAPPVRGLEPVAYHLGHRITASKWVADEHASLGGTVEPLVHLADVSALQGEVKRLREALEPFALLAVDEANGVRGVNMDDPISKWVTVAQLVEARQALEPNQ